MASFARRQDRAEHRNASDPSVWQNFLRGMEKDLPCHSSCVILRWPQRQKFGFIVSPRFDPSATLEFQRRSFAEDPFLELADSEVRGLRDVCDERALRHHPYTRHFTSPHNIRDILSLDLVDGETHGIFRFRFVRGMGEPLFGAHERSTLKSMIPSLRTAASFYAQAAYQDAQLAAYNETAQQLDVASFVLSSTRAIVAKNNLADQIALAHDGLMISNNSLHCTDSESNRKLQSALDEFLAPSEKAGTAGRSLFVRRRDNDGHWSILLRPVSMPAQLDCTSPAAVLVLVRGQRRTSLSRHLLKEVFGFTPKEAELAQRLSEGVTLYDAADQLSISRGTARVHLRSIFAKANVRTQPQLVCALLTAANSAWPSTS
jgi:DNA-binding CsgD family transcriptional regulator